MLKGDVPSLQRGLLEELMTGMQEEASSPSTRDCRCSRGCVWRLDCRQCRWAKKNGREGVLRKRETAAMRKAKLLAASETPPFFVSIHTTYHLRGGRLQLVPERRAARQNFWPAAGVELQTTAKPRTVGRVSGGQFARSPRRSRVYAECRGRAARPVSSRRRNRPPGADWALHVASPPAA